MRPVPVEIRLGESTALRDRVNQSVRNSWTGTENARLEDGRYLLSVRFQGMPAIRLTSGSGQYPWQHWYSFPAANRLSFIAFGRTDPVPGQVLYCSLSAPMRAHFAITVSDMHGSIHDSIRRSWNDWALRMVVVAFSLHFASAGMNYQQRHDPGALEDRLSSLDQGIPQPSNGNAALDQAILQSRALIEDFSDALLVLERDSVPEDGDRPLPPGDRIRILAVHDDEKEIQYPDIGSRMGSIEDLIGPADRNKWMSDSGSLASRAEKAGRSERGGKRIIMQHHLGFGTRCSHLESMDVEPGDIVYTGILWAFREIPATLQAPACTTKSGTWKEPSTPAFVEVGVRLT